MTGSAESFAGALVTSGLMTSAEVEAALSHFTLAQREDSQAVAQAFFSQGKLTSYQAKELLAGRTTGLVLGNYAILDRIGAGGMGVVYKAQHRRMKRVVALKMMPPHVVHSDEAQKRFLREVEAAARLNHPNIVTAYDADEAEQVHFFVMQYVEGSDLAHYVRRCGRLSLRHALDYTLQAARGLHYAHQKGVVHRDIKPGNLLLDTEGVVRVLDMGLARLEHSEGDQSVFQTKEELTGTGRVIGTVDYMAPEQTFDARHADRRADIYSLGCTLYFLLIGRSPVPDGSLTEKLLWHESGPPPTLLEARPDAPPELNVVFRRMMARKPQDRYATLAEAIVELEMCLGRVAGVNDDTLDQRPKNVLPSELDTVAVVIPEIVSESFSPQSPAVSHEQQQPASAETHRGQTRPDATLVDPASHSVNKVHARRREQVMVLPAVAIGVCLVGILVLCMTLYVDRGRSVRSGWNEYVKGQLEKLLIHGVQKPDGRQLYTEIDTALETDHEGDWKVGAGLTLDKQPYAFSVRGSKLEIKPLSRAAALESDLREMSVQSSLDNSFPHRSQMLLMLSKPELRVTTLADGTQRLQGTVFCSASAQKVVEDVALIIERRTQQGRQVHTQSMYQHLNWRRLRSGSQYIDVAAPSPPPAAGEELHLVMIAFLQEPKPSLYRVSNEPACVLGPATASP